MSEEEPPRLPFEQSVEARLMIQYLRPLPMKAFVSYAALSAIVGVEVDGSLPALRTALIRLQRDEGMLFMCIPGKGVERLDDEAIVNDGTARAERMRRMAKRTVERLTVAAFEKLSGPSQRRYSAVASISATVAWMVKPKQMEKIADKSTPERRSLPVNETLTMFASRRKASGEDREEAT